MFSAPLDAELGEPIEYIITFPAHSRNGGGVNLRCLGKVVRVERNAAGLENGSMLVAATLERYEFVRHDS